MKTMFFKKCNWTSIFLWSITVFIVEIFFFFISLNAHSNFVEQAMLWIFFITHISWGIIAGLTYKNNQSVFRRYDAVKNSFTVLSLTVIFLAIAISLWIQIVDPVESRWYVYNILMLVPFTFLFLALWIAGSFFAGYVPAILVRFFSDNFLKNFRYPTKN